MAGASASDVAMARGLSSFETRIAISFCVANIVSGDPARRSAADLIGKGADVRRLDTLNARAVLNH